jgi:hypothetical protein
VQIIESTGQVFANGHAIEVVRATDDFSSLALLHWDGQQSRIANTLELNARIYKPPNFSPTLLRAVRFPAEPRTFGSPATLVENFATVIAKYSGLPNHLSRWTAFFAIATALSDVAGTAPRLIVHGSQSRAVDQLFKVLSALCRHALVLADIPPGGLSSLPFGLGLTLLIRQGKITGRLKQLLLASGIENQFIIHGGRLVSTFAPLVLQVEVAAGNSGMAGIELPMRAVRQPIPFLDSVAMEAMAKEFQDQLLAFRLANLEATRNSQFDPMELASPVRETARSLGVCFSSDPDLQAEIVSLLRNADAHARVLSPSSLEATTIEAMLFLCHEKGGNSGIHVGEIAAAVRVLNKGKEERESPSPRALGDTLRALGFETDRLDKKGRGIMLCQNIRRRVHEIALNLGVPTLAEDTLGCDECRLVRELDGRQDDELQP